MLSCTYRRVVGLSNPFNIYKSIVSERREKSCCYLTEYNLQENVSEANWLDWFLVVKRYAPTASDILPYDLNENTSLMQSNKYIFHLSSVSTCYSGHAWLHQHNGLHFYTREILPRIIISLFSIWNHHYNFTI